MTKENSCIKKIGKEISRDIGKGIIIPDTSFYEVENIMCHGEYDPFPSGLSFIRDFFEFCSIVEAIVLYDGIYTYIEGQGLIWHCSSFGKILENERILRKVPTSYRLQFRIVIPVGFSIPVVHLFSEYQKSRDAVLSV